MQPLAGTASDIRLDAVGVAHGGPGHNGVRGTGYGGRRHGAVAAAPPREQPDDLLLDARVRAGGAAAADLGVEVGPVRRGG